jgi:hypothetical protein
VELEAIRQALGPETFPSAIAVVETRRALCVSGDAISTGCDSCIDVPIHLVELMNG